MSQQVFLETIYYVQSDNKPRMNLVLRKGAKVDYSGYNLGKDIGRGAGKARALHPSPFRRVYPSNLRIKEHSRGGMIYAGTPDAPTVWTLRGAQRTGGALTHT